MQWYTPPRKLALGPGEVHVWLALRGDATSSYIESAGLATDEIVGARRLQRPADRELYLLAHVMLRDVLANYLGVTPIEIVLTSAAHGKPCLVNSHCTDLRFNLSHSGDATLCALTRGREIGVDIEGAVPSKDLLNVATHFFAPDECAALAARNDDDRVALFFLLWTRKEAYLKACGKGLSHPLNAFSVLPSLGVPPDPVVRGPNAGSEGTWCCYGLAAPPGYAAATVVAGPASALTCWRWVPRIIGIL
ncbi:MAG: 4'-phosphopantetheinyl transferase superfamily protein [Gammaproteobacteria bacterium]|nr:4'-phosphopantetheinyl transferase superfamily protein [Gammaproteobacteria bacterium]